MATITTLSWKRAALILLGAAVVGFIIALFILSEHYAPTDWDDFDVLAQEAPPAAPPTYPGGQVPYQEYLQWVKWGEEWFRNETFGSQRLWTDVVGLLDGTVDVPDGSDGFNSERFFKYFLYALDDLDSVRGNLYQGNGGGYTHDLVIRFPEGTMLNQDIPLPEELHTGLDVEAGATWPLGIASFPVTDSTEAELPYLLDPVTFADEIGPVPGTGKFRVGLTCALCHYSLDIDFDGITDLQSARPDVQTPGSPYRPEHAWAIGNQDVSLGAIFAMSNNTIAGFETSAPVGKTELSDAREWARFVLANYENNPEEVKREVDRGLLIFPRGFADDTPDGLHNPLQLPTLFTNNNWPFNYDGVMLNASDRNNNVWTTGLDVSQIVALCKDRGGKAANLVFWEEKGMYSEITAEQYADIVVCHAPAVQIDSSLRQTLRDDILGESDGVPGLLRNDGMALIRGVPFAVPGSYFKRPENAERIRDPKDFGHDGKMRGAMTALLGTRVITHNDIRQQYGVDALEKKYGLNGDEFVTEAVSMMLDWTTPPPNLSPLLQEAQRQGLVKQGYQVFKDQGCASCHAGPFFTDNKIVPLKEIGTDPARASATAPLMIGLAPRYDPKTGEATTGGILGFLSGLIAGKKPGYKTVSLRHLWGSAPYLHDGGVGVGLKPGTEPAGNDLKALLSRKDQDKIYGIAQILNYREANPATNYWYNAALSLQATLLESERDKVIIANKEAVHPIPGRSEAIAIASMHIQGIGHHYWIDDEPGGDLITPLVAFLLALDDHPGK